MFKKTKRFIKQCFNQKNSIWEFVLIKSLCFVNYKCKETNINKYFFMSILGITTNVKIGIDSEWDNSFGNISVQVVDFTTKRKHVIFSKKILRLKSGR